ncbi:MAG: hypothetical protein K8S97_01755, partial [Anaerolineae bacterium]|nr:hypothetical protein [Anaerolineae bacterium]
MAASTSTRLTLIDRALRRMGYVKWRPASVIHKVESPLVGEWGPAPDPAWGQSAQYAGVYMTSPWVYVAVNRIAEASALVPLRVFETSPPSDNGATSPAAGATTS